MKIKMKSNKHYIRSFLTLLLLMCATITFAHDIEVANSDGKIIYYNINWGSSSVSVTYQGSHHYSYSNEYTGDVVIPETVTYGGKTYSVTSIGSYAFYDCSSLTSVTIPNSVTYIGSSAFEGCSGLEKVIVPNIDLKKWCSITFANSTANPLLNANHLYSDENTEITELVIPDSVTSIGSYAFNRCSGLTSVTIPNSVTSIGSYAFLGCSGLTSVTIGNSVTSIGERAFSECSGLTSVTIPNSVTSIGTSAFYYTRIKSLTIGTGIRTIASDAFSYSSSTYGAKPEKVIWLANTPPSGYNDVGGTINYVPNDSYSGLSGQKIYPFLSSMFEVDGIKYVPVSTSERTCAVIDYVYKESTENINIVIPENVTYGDETYGVTSIGSSAFRGRSGLTSVTIPNSVTSIGSYAFYYCSGLTTVTIGNSVTSIGGGAFAGCSGLKKVIVPDFDIKNWCSFKYDADNYNPLYYAHHLYSDENTEITKLVIPNSVTSIGNRAFLGCSGLTSVTIPNSVTSIGTSAFSDCSGLEKVIVPNIDLKKWCSITFANSTANPLLNANHLYSDENTEITELVIPDSVTSIGSYAFLGCSGLTSVTIPNSVTSIGTSAFFSCSGLTSVTIPNSVTSIGSSAFFSCSGLTSVTISNNVTSIGYRAFCNCSGLTSVTIPNNVTSIGSSAFYGCSNLTSITWNAKNCSAFSSYSSNPFYGIGSRIKEFIIGDEVKSIPAYMCYEMSKLKSVTIPNSVTNIGSYAFSYCRNLTSVTIGNSVTSIGAYAFEKCRAINVFKSKAVIPPVCESKALDDINKGTCTLYVPTEETSMYRYIAKEPWTNFVHIEKLNAQGDSNGDDVVNAKDYSGVANYIMGETPEAFDVEASDVDENGTVDVRDYVGIANIITTGSIYGGASNNAKAAMSKGSTMPATDESDAENVIYVENVSGSKNSQVELSVRMKNASDIRGFQFDLYLPEGVSMATNAKASLSSDRLAAGDAHTLMVDEMTNGEVRFLCSSMNDESFAGGDGEIATLTVNIADNVAIGEYDVVVKNAIMTETDISKSYEADNIKSTLTVLDQTGVETVTANDERRDGTIYTVGGQLVGKKATTSQLRKGIYIRNGKKIVVK